MNENFYKIFTSSQGFALIASIDDKQVYIYFLSNEIHLSGVHLLSLEVQWILFK